MYNPMTNLYAPQYPDQYARPYAPTVSYPQQSDSSIIWVQGESGAKAFPVQNGKSVVLFDSETERFFIKTADASGMPQPLRIFSYSEDKEPKSPSADNSAFITREEFDNVIKELKQSFVRKENKPNGKPVV